MRALRLAAREFVRVAGSNQDGIKADLCHDLCPMSRGFAGRVDAIGIVSLLR